MLVRLNEKVKTTIGTIGPGVFDLPVVEALRVIKSHDADVEDIVEDDYAPEFHRKNRMIKGAFTR